jgi:hypothetical protein
MGESRRDFQRVWEGWRAGIMGIPCFPYSVISMARLSPVSLDKLATPLGPMLRPLHDMVIVIGCQRVHWRFTAN